MKLITLKLPDPERTRRLGMLLAQLKIDPLVVALNGPLGAGKTTLAQGLARALDIPEPVNSPTFTMLNEYRSGKKPFAHLDFYRFMDLSTAANRENTLFQYELDEVFRIKGVAVVEWAELMPEYLPEEHITVVLNYSEDSNTRTAEISATTENLRNELFSDEMLSKLKTFSRKHHQ